MKRVLSEERHENGKEAKRTEDVYLSERTKNARYTWVQRDDVDGLRAIRPNFASNWTTYLQKVHKDGWGWFNRLFDFQQLRLAPPSCLPILNHVNSWLYVIGLRSRRVFFPYATLLKPWSNYPTLVGRTYLLENMFDGNQTSSNIWLSKNCSMNGYDKQSNNVVSNNVV